MRTVLRSVLVGKISMPNPNGTAWKLWACWESWQPEPNGTAWRWTKHIRNEPTTSGKLLLLHLSSRNDCNVNHDPLPLNWASGKQWGPVPCFGHVQTYTFAVKLATYTAPRAITNMTIPKLSTQQPSGCNVKPLQTMLRHVEARLHRYSWIEKSYIRVRAEGKHTFILIYRGGTENLHSTHVELSLKRGIRNRIHSIQQ